MRVLWVKGNNFPNAFNFFECRIGDFESRCKRMSTSSKSFCKLCNIARSAADACFYDVIFFFVIYDNSFMVFVEYFIEVLRKRFYIIILIYLIHTFFLSSTLIAFASLSKAALPHSSSSVAPTRCMSSLVMPV